MQRSLNMASSVFVMVIAALSLWSSGAKAATMTACLQGGASTTAANFALGTEANTDMPNGIVGTGAALTSNLCARQTVTTDGAAAVLSQGTAFCTYYMALNTAQLTFRCTSATGVCKNAVSGYPGCYPSGDTTATTGGVFCCDNADNCNGASFLSTAVACTLTTTAPTTTAGSTTTAKSSSSTSGTTAQPTARASTFLGAACMAVTFLAAVGL